MKLKITNKWNGEVIELEGTEQELAYFMSNYKPQYNYQPWFVNVPSVSSSTPCLLHNFDFNSTAPTCKNCGAHYLNITYPQITSSGVTLSGNVDLASTTH